MESNLRLTLLYNLPTNCEIKSKSIQQMAGASRTDIRQPKSFGIKEIISIKNLHN